jgi:hypothetical protein
MILPWNHGNIGVPDLPECTGANAVPSVVPDHLLIVSCDGIILRTMLLY